MYDMWKVLSKLVPFLLYTRLKRNWAENLIKDGSSALKWFSRPVSWHSSVPEWQFFSYKKALLKKDRRGILIGKEKEKHFIRHFTGVTAFN